MPQYEHTYKDKEHEFKHSDTKSNVVSDRRTSEHGLALSSK